MMGLGDRDLVWAVDGCATGSPCWSGASSKGRSAARRNGT